MPAFVRRVAGGAGRVLAGWALVAAGALALAGAVAAGVAGGHRTEVGFTAPLFPVHTDGHAILVPDVGAVLDRHGLARLLGDGQLTITVRSASVPAADLVVALVPSPDAVRHLGGTAHTELLAVGYAPGLQPVHAVDRPGREPDGPAPWEAAPDQSGAREVTLSLSVPTGEPVALVVRRSDRAPDLTVAITVGFAPASWGVASTVLWIGGALATLTGLALLLMRRPVMEIPDDLAELDALMPAPPREISPYVYTAT